MGARGLGVGVGGVLRAVGVAALQEVEEAGGVGRPVHGQTGDRHALHAVLAQGQLLAWRGGLCRCRQCLLFCPRTIVCLPKVRGFH